MPPPVFLPISSPNNLSYYDVSPLKSLLGRLVDFDLLNAGKMRLSVGAVNVRTGKVLGEEDDDLEAANSG